MVDETRTNEMPSKLICEHVFIPFGQVLGTRVMARESADALHLNDN